MPDVLPVYATTVARLAPLLCGLPKILVGIDGRDGVGKTTLARYLAWNFNISLVEGDLHMKDGCQIPEYHLDELNRIIKRRLDRRPVIVESVGLFHLLEKLGRAPNFVIYCESNNADNDDPDNPVCAWLNDYHKKYGPRDRADFVANTTRE